MLRYILKKIKAYLVLTVPSMVMFITSGILLFKEKLTLLRNKIACQICVALGYRPLIKVIIAARIKVLCDLPPKILNIYFL